MSFGLSQTSPLIQLARLAEPVWRMGSEDALDHGQEAQLSVWGDTAPEICSLPLSQLLQCPSGHLNKKDLARCDNLLNY